MINPDELKAFLDQKANQYNQPTFVEHDPIQVPHQYTLKQDIEIAAFLTATIAWGNRKTIIRSAKNMMQIMGNSPYDYVMNFNPDAHNGLHFVHRTFNATDFLYFLKALRHIYENKGGLEAVLTPQGNDLQLQISHFKKIFFEIPHPQRTQKHLSDPKTGSAAKRVNMFLRWMCRKDNNGVDFGLWSIPMSILSCPLDVHSGNIARKLGILTRKQNDAKALAELDANLRRMDPHDPVKYDFALFGLGVNEHF